MQLTHGNAGAGDGEEIIAGILVVAWLVLVFVLSDILILGPLPGEI